MKVARLNTTPVKGLALHEPAAIEIGEHGVADNRRFYLIDRAGAMFNGKKEGRLARIRADYDVATDALTLLFPDGTVVTGTCARAQAVTTNFYGRPVVGHVVDGPWAQAISTFVGQPVRLVAADTPGDAVDVHPVTLVSNGSIERLSARATGIPHIARRFRMLVETDGAVAHEEDTWKERHVRIGTAVVSVVGPVPRCVVVAQNPETGARDFDALRVIFEDRGAMTADLSTPTAHLPDGGKIVFGVYGLVVTPGRVAVGDDVVLI